jgi:hypothetical protein
LTNDLGNVNGTYGRGRGTVKSPPGTNTLAYCEHW